MTQLTDTTLTLTANQSTDRLVIPPKLNKQMPPLPATMDDFNLIKVLGKGCMGKVSKQNHYIYIQCISYTPQKGPTCSIQKR